MLAWVLSQPCISRPGETKGSLVRKLFFDQPYPGKAYTPDSIQAIYAFCPHARSLGIFVKDLSYEITTSLSILPEWAQEVHWDINSSHLTRQIPGRLVEGIRFLALLNIGGQTLTLSMPYVETLHISSDILLSGDSHFPALKDLLIVFKHQQLRVPAWFYSLLRKHAPTLETLALDSASQETSPPPAFPILPVSILSSCIHLHSIIFNPLIGIPFEREPLASYLPSLTSVGFFLTYLDVGRFTQAWNFLRRDTWGEGVERLQCVFYHNNIEEVERVGNLFGYDERLEIGCRWGCTRIRSDNKASGWCHW